MELKDFNPDAISDILSTLSSDDVENLSKIAEQFFSSEGSSSGKAKEERHSSGFPCFDGLNFDADSMMKIMRLLNRMKNQPEDSRIRFLYALKPMLTKRRHHKIDEAVEILRIISILPLLRE